MYCIYRIINKLNNKTYIGQHKYKDLSIDEYMGSGKYLLRAIEKYGIENFEREILISEVKTKEEINKLEIECIKLERESGHGEYNLSNGGEGWNLSGENHPWYGKHLPEETKRKISEANKKENLSEETLKRKSEAKKGENNPSYGKHPSEETRLKISEANKGKYRTDETRRRLSEAQKGKHLSEETRKKISESHKGLTFSEETRKKLSESHKRENLSEETRKRMSESRKGENNPFYGKHFSEEARKRRSEAHKYRIGKRYYTNGVECHMYISGTEPEGYILGKSPKIKDGQL